MTIYVWAEHKLGGVREVDGVAVMPLDVLRIREFQGA